MSSKKIKWVLVALATVVVAIILFIKISDGEFLKYGVLKIKHYPKSLTIVNNKSAGWPDQEYEYKITLNSNDVKELLSGRIYNLQRSVAETFVSVPDNFPVETCLTSGNLNNGLVTIFFNIDKSEAYIIYDIN